MSEEPEYKLDDSITERDLLFRIARELTLMRKQMTEAISYMRQAESEVPESLRRFANYMHDIHDIKYMYEELGHPVPEHHKQELQRCDDRYRQILKTMHTDGGALEKIRREMAADPENRWDHTKQIPFKRSGL
jgi:hypothetical protein